MDDNDFPSWFTETYKQLLKEGEDHFLKVTSSYPFVVHGTYPSYEDDPKGCLSFIENASRWLEENITNDYLAFPDCAMGKYKECCRNVYFSNNNDAIYYKLNLG